MNQSTVSYFDGVALAKKISAVRYIEVSAITGEGVDEAFEVVFCQILPNNDALNLT
jgi:hypothetical protein